MENHKYARYSICSECRGKIDKDMTIYCESCYTKNKHEFEQAIKDYQARTDEMQSKLLILESNKKEQINSPDYNNQTLVDLENRVNNLIQKFETIREFLINNKLFLQTMNNIEQIQKTLEQYQK